MITRFTGLLAAVLACMVSQVQAQDGSLTAFRSEGELVRFLRSLEPPPPGPVPPQAPEQSRVVITGRVIGSQRQPVPDVIVRIESLNVGAVTGADGRYRLVVPNTRFQPGQSVTITTDRTGLRPMSRTLTLHPGTQHTQNFVVAAAPPCLYHLVIWPPPGTPASVIDPPQDGVDEGDIVKVHGDYLVILRRGRLFTVDVGGGRLRPADAVDAFGPGTDPRGTWYEELLVSDGQVVVIGHGHFGGDTKVGLFSIGRTGRLQHQSTYRLSSGDDYPLRATASLLAGGKLVLYAPAIVGDPADIAGWMPAVRRWRADATDEASPPTLRPTRIYRPGQYVADERALLLHTVTTCDLARGELDCESTAILGPEADLFYVSPTAVYLWVSDGRATEPRSGAMVYRMPLDGAAPATMGVDGWPVDQFSFLESDDGYLNVLVRSRERSEATWASGWENVDVRLLRVPLARFRSGRRAAPRRAYRALPRLGGADALINRFVGGHLLYGQTTEWGSPGSGGSVLYVVRWRDGELTQIPLPALNGIEVMGSDAVVVGADTADVHLTSIRLDDQPRLVDRYVQRGASQDETFTHGFFYRHDGPGNGVVGLLVANPARPGYEHLFEAGVRFLRNDDGRFRPLGELFAETASVDAEADACIAGCEPWYGNARPIFLRGRTFALLGYEIVEGALEGGRLREVRRVTFAPPAAQAAP